MVVLYVSPQDTIANSTIQKLKEAYREHEEYEPETFRLSYHDMRVSQLQELDKDTLIKWHYRLWIRVVNQKQQIAKWWTIAVR